MRKTFFLILFLAIFYLAIYFTILALQFTYNNFNIYSTFISNIVLIALFVYFIDKFVKKIDGND